MRSEISRAQVSNPPPFKEIKKDMPAPQAWPQSFCRRLRRHRKRKQRWQRQAMGWSLTRQPPLWALQAGAAAKVRGLPPAAPALQRAQQAHAQPLCSQPLLLLQRGQREKAGRHPC